MPDSLNNETAGDHTGAGSYKALVCKVNGQDALGDRAQDNRIGELSK